MSNEWCTIESDPGVFTELICNIGTKGLQVNEILDLDELSDSNNNVYGVIFLFKYVKNSGYKPNVLTVYDPDLFFAKQTVMNACATQAILGVLLNLEKNTIDIGETLKDFKEFTKDFDPILKGNCIGDCNKIREEHNKFTKPSTFIETSKKRKANDDDDVFHFVSYLHFKNSIYEIDGLQEGPILIKDNIDKKDWTPLLKDHISERIALYANYEIKFNLLYITDDKLMQYKQSLNAIDASIEELTKKINSNENAKDVLEKLQKEIITKNNERYDLNYLIKEEEKKRNISKEENERRQHNYIPLIFDILKHLSENDNLNEIYNQAMNEDQQNNINMKKEV